MRIRTIVAFASALLVAVSLIVIGVTMPGRQQGSQRPVPKQWSGTAAGMSHRVPATTSLGRVVNGRIVPARTTRRVTGPTVGTSTARVPGAVPPATRPKALNLPVTQAGTEKVGSASVPGTVPVKGFDPGTSLQLPLTQPDQVSYVNADGTRTTDVYEHPVNYRLPDGSWAPISTTLVPDGAVTQTGPAASPQASGGSAPAASAAAGSASALVSPSAMASAAPPVSPSPTWTASSAPAPVAGWTEQSAASPVTFGGDASAPDLVSLPLGGGRAVAFGVAGAAPVAGTVTGSTVSYPDALPDSTIRYTAGTGTVKEEIVLNSPAAPTTWVFPLDLTGLHALTGPGGSVEFADAAGRVVAYVPHGTMTDSNIDPHSGEGVTSGGVTYSLVTVGGRPAIRMTLDAAWLASKARVFPVTVDPTTSAYNADGSVYAQSDPSGTFSGTDVLKVGTYNGGTDTAKSFISFGSVASTLHNDTVLGVQLNLYEEWSYSCSPRPVWVYPITSSWSPASVSGLPGPSTGPAVGEKSFAYGWVQLGQSTSPCPPPGSPGPGGWVQIPLKQSGTDLVNGWTHGTVPDNGLAIGASGSDSYSWKKFAPYSSGAGSPSLTITYTTDGASYKMASGHAIKEVLPSQNGTLAIKVTNTGKNTWTPTNGYQLSYRAYAPGDLKNPVADHPVFTKMPSSVAPGQTVTVNAAVNSLPSGNYIIEWDMYSGAPGSPVSFSSQGIQFFAMGLTVPVVVSVSNVYPATGYIASTLRQQLSTTATATGTLTYAFTVTCQPLPGQTCTNPTPSGSLTKPYWTPSASQLQWNTPYQWKVVITGTSGGTTTTVTVSGIVLEYEVPQPALTSLLGGASGRAYDPLSGNYTTSATDAAVAGAGMPLQVDRTFNSMDPRTTGAFGAGWASVADTALRPDNDGTSNVTVTLPSGRQLRFGLNSNGTTYTPPFGSHDVLAHNSTGTWTLKETGGVTLTFTSAGVISQITDPDGQSLQFTVTSGQVTAIKDAASQRALAVTWATPAGTTHPHVSTVTTPAPDASHPGYTWTYNYTGDELTGVCGPSGCTAACTSGCTSYTYGTSGSLYRPTVLDSRPRAYWQLGEPAGATSAGDEVDVNLDTTSGTYSNVTSTVAGPLAGSGVTAAAFNGTSSSVALPPKLISDSTDQAIGLWFKAASGSSGVLFSYAAQTIANPGGNFDPVLYIGTTGDLYGEFWNGHITPIITAAAVTDGNWHYVVLTAASTTQSMYLDGTLVGSLSGTIDNLGMSIDTIGAGDWNSWPAKTTATIGYFHGDIGQVAVYDHPLGQPAIAAQYAAKAASPELTATRLPSGRTYEQVTYDADTDRVQTYTDQNEGRWTIGRPVSSGSRPNADGLGQVVATVNVTDPAGRQQSYGYDMLDGGRLITYSNGVDPLRSFGYDAAGFLASVVDQDSNLACFTNDIRGDVLTRTWYPVEPASLPGGGIGTVAPCGGSTTSDPACWSDGAPCTTFYGYATYDSANPLDPVNGKLTSVRDARSASATDNTYLTKYTYNSAGQLLTETTPPTSDFPSGRATTYTYTTGTEAAYQTGTEPAGLLASTATPGGATTTFQYYQNGDLGKVTEPSGRATTYVYDLLGRATSATVTADQSTRTTNYAYTPTNQTATVTYPATPSQVSGNAPHTRQDAYSYDADGNPLSLTESDLTGGDASRTTTYNYNDDGQMESVTQPAGATTGGGSQTEGASSPNPLGATTTYTYDALGNVSQVIDPNGTHYKYDYNEYNKPTDVKLYTDPATEANPTASCTAPAVQDSSGGCDLVLESYGYDPAGQLASATDAMGHITNYTHDNNQDLIAVSVTDPTTSPITGRQAIYGFDAAGNQISTTVSGLTNGTVKASTLVSYPVDAADRVTSLVADKTPPAGGGVHANRTVAYTYKADNQVLSQTVGTAVTTFGYDTAGNTINRIAQDGSTSYKTTWTYSQDGQQLSMTTPAGNAAGAVPANFTTNYTYDPAGRLSTVTGPPRQTVTYGTQAVSIQPTTAYGYDTYGDQTHVTDPNGETTVTAYDGDGRVTSVTPPSYTPPGASAPVSGPITYAYDEDGRLTKVTDPAGNVTAYAYDALGNLASMAEPQLPGQSAPGTWTYTYDAIGELLSATDPIGNGPGTPPGHTASMTYNYYGEHATATDATGNTTSYAHDFLGDLTKATTADNVATTYGYDNLGELTSATDAYGNTSSYAYDDAGRPTYAYNPDGGYEKYGYDPAGNPVTVTDYGAVPSGQTAPQLRSESFGYDPSSGYLTSATDWNGHTTTYGYDAAGELTSRAQPVSSSSSITTSFGYDPAGNQTASTNGVTGQPGNTTWTTYNAWNLPEKVIKPATTAGQPDTQRTWTTGYDALGHPASVSQPGGITQAYAYDPLGDLMSQSGAGASAATTTQTFGYDLNGRLTQASAPGGTDTFGYDGAGRLTSASGPSGTSGFSYNGDGLLTTMTSPAGSTTYGYDSADRLATESEPLSGGSMTWAYNANSLPTSISYASGGAAGPVQAFTYDPLNRLASDIVTSAGGATLASQAYGYDASGNMTSQATGGQMTATSAAYGYDQANRITSAVTGSTTTSYGYDGDGNLTQNGSTTNAYNAQDQLTSSTAAAGTTGYTYTLSGALASVTPPGGSAQNYTSDAFGQVITAPGGISYGYDAVGRLTTRTSGSTTTSMSYLGGSSTLASDGSHNYSYDASGAMTGVAAAASGSTGYVTMNDVHGDLSATFSPTPTANGLAGYATYSPYGVPATSGYKPDLGYQGDYTDPATGQVNMGARWYNPSTGGFTTSDAIGGSPVPLTADGNPYAYANGNPLTGTDPTGHGTVCVTVTLYGASVTICVGSGGGGGGGGDAGEGGGGAPGGNAGESGGKPGGNAGEGGGSVNGRQSPLPGPGQGPGCSGSCYTPPPPPPPQNCYAAATCAPVPLPPGFQHDPRITDPVNYNVDYHQLFRDHQDIVEKPPRDKSEIGGTKERDTCEASCAPFGGDSGLVIERLIDIGTPASPTAPLPTFTPLPSTNPRLVGITKFLLKQFETSIVSMGKDAWNCAVHQDTSACAWTVVNILLSIPTDGEGAILGDAARTALDDGARVADTGISDIAKTACRPMSFSSDTKVLLADGKTAPIASLKPGDKVMATDTKTGKTSPETVTAVEVNHDTDLYDLKVKTAHGSGVIHTTASHLFWDPAAGKWIRAAALRKGEPLRTSEGTPVIADGGTTPRNHQGWMWDLTVPGNNDHDFYVVPVSTSSSADRQAAIAGESGNASVLVHNSVCSSAARADASTAPNTAFFWTGVHYSDAARIARAKGGTTLARVMRARGVAIPKFVPGDPLYDDYWSLLSARYASAASGDVYAIIGPTGAKPNSIWTTIEYPILRNNPAVTRIITVDPVTGDETVIFRR